MRKISILFLFCIYSIIPILGQSVFVCHTTTGNWLDLPDQGDSFYWMLEQYGNTVTGTVRVNPECQFTTWDVHGSIVNGQFDLTAVNPSGGDSPFDNPVACVGQSFNQFGYNLQPGCDSGEGTYSGIGGTGSFIWAKACRAPLGELSDSYGWMDSVGQPTVHKWMQTLYPQTNDNWGRIVYETFPIDGVDTCHFDGSAIDYIKRPISSNWWPIYEDGKWGTDDVGFTKSTVTYYRRVRPIRGLSLPCGVQVQQRMYASCNLSGNLLYSEGPLRAEMDMTSVSSSRAGQTAIRLYVE